MLTLHQLKCFLSVYETGSFTAAAEQLGYTQPSISEQIRLLEKSLGITLFERVGRGVLATDAAQALRPHAEATIAASLQAIGAVQSNKQMENGTIRFGMFSGARLWASAQLVNEVLSKYPGLRIEIIGRNSTEVLEDIKRGRIEAALISPPFPATGLSIQPVARDELVYVSADRSRTDVPISTKRLTEVPLVMPEVSFRATDSNWIALNEIFQAEGAPLKTRVEVEDEEAAIELVGLGVGDTVVTKGVALQLIPRLAPNANWCSLKPKKYQTFSIVTRENASLSPASRYMIDMAVNLIKKITSET